MTIEQNISLKSYNTFGIDVAAEFFCACKNIDQIREALSQSAENRKTTPPLVLGGGSNILLTTDVRGFVIKNDIKGIEKVDEDTNSIIVKAGAGENWHQFVLYCLENDLAGVENLALIPGNVGASPMQNIGAYGVEIKDVFHSLDALDIDTGQVTTFDNATCGFGYRESVFKNKYKGRFIITTVSYKLSKTPIYNISYGAIEAELEKMNVKDLSIRSIAQAVMNIRSSKLPDPKVIGNAGSFFKNPEITLDQFEALKRSFPNIIGYALGNEKIKLAAGWLIEQCGWKGYRKGDAGCHAQQALVLVNYGNAKGSDILQLSEEIINAVSGKFGVMLEREVNIV